MSLWMQYLDSHRVMFDTNTFRMSPADATKNTRYVAAGALPTRIPALGDVRVAAAAYATNAAKSASASRPSMWKRL